MKTFKDSNGNVIPKFFYLEREGKVSGTVFREKKVTL